MKNGFLRIAAALAFAWMPAAAQSAKNYTPPKTPWGDPDLQGEWPAVANVPLERPAGFGRRGYVTEEEFAERVKRAEKQGENDEEGATLTINPPAWWNERGKPERQTSLVVDPPDGRLPRLTPEGEKLVKGLRGGRGPGQKFPARVESWEDFDTFTRCISRGLVGSMLPYFYNPGNQIVQGPGYVVIRNEMIHEARVIPLDGRPHAGAGIRTYMGDPRGHWEGNTLVVESTNFNGQTGVGAGFFSDAARLVERFTRTGAEDLSYDLTVDDPRTWTRPFTIHMPYHLDPSYAIYEYACHEANYMMTDSLTAARALEGQGKATKVDANTPSKPNPLVKPR